MNRDLFLAILSMDSYNRSYGVGVNLPAGANQIGNAIITRDSSSLVENGVRQDIPAGFYALAYDVSGAGISGLDGTVIAYRGSDYEDTNGNILRSNDLWQGWTNAAGFPFAGQPGLALAFYRAVTGAEPYDTPGNGTLTGHSLGGSLAGFVSALSGNTALLFDHLPFGVSAYLQSLAATGTVGSVRPGLPDAYFVENDVAALTRSGALSLVSGGLSGAAIGAYFGSPLIGAAVGAVALASATATLDSQVDNSELSQFDAGIGATDAHSQALLVLLLWARENANGRIDDISELFGNATQGGYAELARSANDNDVCREAAFRFAGWEKAS